MFDWIGKVLFTLIYQPQLNFLEFWYQQTHDIGWAIVILATIVNVSLWPLFGSNYLNSLKLRILNPRLRELQEKYKETPQELWKKTREFNKEHNIKNGAIFWILIFQLFFVSGLFFLTQDVSKGQPITGLYTAFFGTDKAQFSNTAFGFLDIGKSSWDNLWLPITAAFLSYIQGMYTFRWSPKPKLPPQPKAKKKEGDKPAMFDPEQFQKSLEFQQIYIFPFMYLLLNISATTGVNLYLLTVSILAIARQFFLVNFYAKHVDKLVADLEQTDPAARKDKHLYEDLQFAPEGESVPETDSPIVKSSAQPKKKPFKKSKKK
jgi:YidC/Oxa1 family membrane protein insertase